MNNIIEDIKTVSVASLLMVWEGLSEWMVATIFIFFQINELENIKLYVNFIVWSIGVLCGSIYVIFRAYDMIQKALKSKLEKEIASIEKKDAEKNHNP